MSAGQANHHEALTLRDDANNVDQGNEFSESENEDGLFEVIELEDSSSESENNETMKHQTESELSATPKRLRQEVLNEKASQSPVGTCIICLEPWTNSAEHRLVSLNCGHLFGKICIEKWVKSCGRQAKCPQCNTTAKFRDIRPIFATKTVKVLDTSERDRALQDLAKEREEKRKLKIELAKNQGLLKTMEAENERLKSELNESRNILKEFRKEKITGLHKNNGFTKSSLEPFQLVSDININSLGGCKVICCSTMFDVAAVSQQSDNPLYTGWGIRKVSLQDFKVSEFIYIHKKPIKDMVFNNYNATLLSTSTDKTIQLTSMLNKSNVLSYELPIEAWSLAFNPQNNDEFFAGLRNGKVLRFDTRVTSSPVGEFQCPTTSPVVSIQYLDYTNSNGSTVKGVLTTQLNTSTFHERDNINKSHFHTHPIPLQGLFTSSHVEQKSGLVLLSCRPSYKHQKFTHSVLNFRLEDQESRRTFFADTVQNFEGGTECVQLVRSKIFPHPENYGTALVCAGDETLKSILIWDVCSNSSIQKIASSVSVLDIEFADIGGNKLLMALDDKNLRFFKWSYCL